MFEKIDDILTINTKKLYISFYEKKKSNYIKLSKNNVRF